MGLFARGDRGRFAALVDSRSSVARAQIFVVLRKATGSSRQPSPTRDVLGSPGRLTILNSLCGVVIFFVYVTALVALVPVVSGVVTLTMPRPIAYLAALAGAEMNAARSDPLLQFLEFQI